MSEDIPSSRKWAEFKFSVIGHLLASPPPFGKLQEELRILSSKLWKHPQTGQHCKYSKSTLERWYYLSLKERETPIKSLLRKTRNDVTLEKVMTVELKKKLDIELGQHQTWSMKLHSDNLAAIIRKDQLGPIPSYSTVRRFLKKMGYQKKSIRNDKRKGQLRAEERVEKWETRSYENPYVGGLWHLDFHVSSREVIISTGEIVYPKCLGVIDDHSRLLCHIQWYLHETAEDLIHGFCQALQKRGLPRSLLTDNGSAMISKEFTRGLNELGILHETTLPYSPHQNGKQEVVWGQIEGRLLAMLENKKVLTLKELNEATIAWAEMEYNRKVHSEIKTTPLARYLNNKGVTRTCPESKRLKEVFRAEEKRTVRRSDGTISIEGIRFEIPSRYRHLEAIRIQYAKWDLSSVDLVDENTGNVLVQLYPVNKQRNSSGERRIIEQESKKHDSFKEQPRDGIAPLLEEILGLYAATGMPFAYQPKNH